MSFRIPIETLQDDLRRFFDASEESCFVIHTDITHWGFPIGLRGREEVLDAYVELLLSASLGRHVVLPTFNYDYGRSRVYDVQKDPCQVGVLNEHIRKKFLQWRTRTPMFSFVSMTPPLFSLEPSRNPFGSESLWKDFCDRNGRVVFLGMDTLAANTFGIYVEELRKTGYRYFKPMPGTIVDDGKRISADFDFRVRPRRDVLVEWDPAAWKEDLIARKILSSYPLGNTTILSFNALQLLEYWLSRMQDDELFLLTLESRKSIEEYRTRGGAYPFRYEDFEL